MVDRADAIERVPARLRNALTVGSVALFAAAVVAGYGVTALSAGTVTLPLLGPVSGQLLGLAGLATLALAYRQFGCAGGCGTSGDCGCSDECGDRCSSDR